MFLFTKKLQITDGTDSKAFAAIYMPSQKNVDEYMLAAKIAKHLQIFDMWTDSQRHDLFKKLLQVEKDKSVSSIVTSLLPEGARKDQNWTAFSQKMRNRSCWPQCETQAGDSN